MTGWSQGVGTGDDYATVKYDAEGNEIWVTRYNGPGNSEDRPSAIALDACGNVFVTGSSGGGGTSFDYATVKYASDGNQIWAARYNGPENRNDFALALALDAEGNVYVTGGSWRSPTAADYATIKYDSDGNQLWVARYSGPGNGADHANKIAVDAAGNVYVTGASRGVGTNFDYTTIKYDSDGNQIWVARYNGLASLDDNALAIALDADGNVYVTGGSFGVGTGLDYATIKYDEHGNEVWVARYNGPGNGFDQANAIAVDCAGNVYVTGYSLGVGTGDDYTTIKYDALGNEIWVARYNGPASSGDLAWALALTPREMFM